MLTAAERDVSSSLSAMPSAITAPSAMSDDLKERLLREAVSWKMNNKRLLDEIVAREMPQREVLMEKVRREIQFDRAMVAWGFDNGKSFNPVFDCFDEERNCIWKICPDLVRNFTPSVLQSLHLPTLENEKRAATPSSEIDFQPGNQFQTNMKSSGIKRKLEETAPATCTGQSSADIANKPKAKDYDNSCRNLNRKAGNMKSSPAKRTKPNDPSQNWSCSICKINTSSEINLQSHLQGKMHKSNLKFHKPYQQTKKIVGRLEQLISSPGQENSRGDAISTAGNNCSSFQIASTNPDKKYDENSSPLTTVSPDRSDRVSSKLLKKTAAPAETETGSDGKASVEETVAFSTNAMRLKMQLDGVLHEVIQAGGYLWCELCRLKFNGAAMMANHLSGAAHVAALNL